MVSNFSFLFSHRIIISVSTHFEREVKVPWNRVTGRQQILKKFHQHIIVINTKEAQSHLILQTPHPHPIPNLSPERKGHVGQKNRLPESGELLQEPI